MARYRFYTSSKKTWLAMLDAIARAERSVFIEMYIMVDDASGAEFIELLGRKASEGVTVKLVLDSFGSFSLSDQAIRGLRAAGVEVLFFSQWLHRLHRKVVIVDERTVITGGVNIHRGAEGWTDLALRVNGGFASHTALHLFAATYFKAGGTDQRMRGFLSRRVASGKPVAFVSLGGPHEKLRRLYTEKLLGAKRSIDLVTPYFVPDRWLVAALDTASIRGVSVRIVVPKKSDSWLMDRANYFYMAKMDKTNFDFFLFPGMNHAKLLLVDEAEALVGSQNLDALSFNRNIESGVWMTDPEAVESISGIVKGWEEKSELFEKGKHVRRWYDYILAPLIFFFQPFL